MVRVLTSIVISVAYCLLATTTAQRSRDQNVNDFDVIDLNKDQIISKSEFEQFYHNLRSSTTTNVKAQRLFASHDLDSDGHLTVAEFVPLAFALSRQPFKEEEQFFNRLDENGDRVLTRAEIQRSDEKIGDEIINGLFLVADTNQDGRITYREYEIVTGANQNTPVFATEHTKISQNAQHAGIGQSLMVSIDEDRDERLSKAEVTNFINRFNTKKVSPLEISNVFNRLDKNRDGFLIVSELQDFSEQMIQILGVRPMPNIPNVAFGK